jgi:hypothetical protein
LYQVSSNSNNGTNIGSSYTIIPQTNATSLPISIYTVNNFVTQEAQYLQYYFFDNENANNNLQSLNTGGVVLGIKQTKCIRINGMPLSDSTSSTITTGSVQYTIIATTSDPINTSNVQTVIVDTNGDSNTISSENAGYLAFNITNLPSQYQNSTGQYNLKISTISQNISFNSDILITVNFCDISDNHSITIT